MRERFETVSAKILATNACKCKCHKNLCNKCMCQANILLKSQQFKYQDIPDEEVIGQKTKNGKKDITGEKESNNFTIAVNAEIKTVELKGTENLQINALDVNEENTVQLDNLNENTVQLDNLNKIQDKVSELQKIENHFNLKKKQNMLLNSLFK